MSISENVFVVVYEMLSDRGYLNIESKEDLCIIARNNQDKRIIVYFVESVKVSVKKMKSIKDMIQNDHFGFHALILVYKSTITSFAKQFITTDVDGLLVQVFSEKELCFNITKHKLVPKHELMTDTEKHDTLSEYKTKLKNYPNILCNDPVSKYYGFVPGNLIKITRKSPTVGTFVSYRVVV